jgi:hypothetical protein
MTYSGITIQGVGHACHCAVLGRIWDDGVHLGGNREVGKVGHGHATAFLTLFTGR